MHRAHHPHFLASQPPTFFAVPKSLSPPHSFRARTPICSFEAADVGPFSTSNERLSRVGYAYDIRRAVFILPAFRTILFHLVSFRFVSFRLVSFPDGLLHRYVRRLLVSRALSGVLAADMLPSSQGLVIPWLFQALRHRCGSSTLSTRRASCLICYARGPFPHPPNCGSRF